MRKFTFNKEAEVYNSDSTDKISIETEYKTGKKFMSGLFSVIADTSKVVFKYNNLEEAKNVGLAISSDMVIKKNTYDELIWKKPSVFSYENSNIVFDGVSKLNPARTVKGLVNSFINMPNIKIDGSNADDYIEFNISTPEFKKYFTSQKLNQHDPNAALYLSPKFVNDGISNFWTVDSANALYTNEELAFSSFESWNDYCNLISSFPRNLNGNILKINFYNNNVIYVVTNSKTEETELVSNSADLFFNNFSGGLLQLTSEKDKESVNQILQYNANNTDNTAFKEVVFENCSNIDISFITFKDIRLKFINCYNVNIRSCTFEVSDNIGTTSDKNSVIISDSSKINIVNCIFNVSINYLNNVYKIYATNASKVFVNPNCVVKVGETKHIAKFKKAYIDNNSQVTWFSGDDKKISAMENVNTEFNFAEFSNGLANHQHSAITNQFGSEFIVEDIDPDSATDETKIEQLIDSITHTIPVGTTFYWPRAYLINNISGSVTDGVLSIPTSEASYSTATVSSNFVTLNPHDTENYKTIYNDGITIELGKDNIKGKFTHEIPFLSGVIPFDRKINADNTEAKGADGNTWSKRWENEITKITKKTGITLADLQKIPDTTVINSKLFKTDETDNFKYLFKKDIFLSNSSNTKNQFTSDDYTINGTNKFLNFTGINFNFTGPSVRQERADRFGFIQYFNNAENGCGFVIKAGATHNWGGSQNTPFASKPTAVFQQTALTNKDDKTINWPTKYAANVTEIAPPHDEFWYARQGLHVVYQVGGIIDKNGTVKLPEYLEYGYLKFDISFNRNLNGLGNWFGTLMVCDNYTVVKKSVYTRENSASGFNWPKEKFAPAVSFIYNSLTKYNNKNGKPEWYDPEDVPTFGNYFIEGNKTVYLPLNKIAGKFLVFGIRGTTSTKSRERDNGVYTGEFRAYNMENALENCTAITFKNFTIVPSIQPIADFKNEKWRLSNNSSIILKTATVNTDPTNLAPQIDLAGTGLRYYTDVAFLSPTDTTNSKKLTDADKGKSLSSICDLYIENSIISDTVLCMKADEIVGLSDVKDRNIWTADSGQGVMWCFDSDKAKSLSFSTSCAAIFNGAGFKFTEDISNTNLHRFLEQYYPDLSATYLTGNDLISGFNIKTSVNANENTNPNGYLISGFPSVNITSVGAYTFNTGGTTENPNIIYSKDSSVFSLYNGIELSGNFDDKDDITEFNLYNYNYNKNGVSSETNKLAYINNEAGNIWNYNAAYFQYKLAADMFDAIGQHLTSVNGMPYQYYSPFLPTNGGTTDEIPVQLVKYNMGIINYTKETSNALSDNQKKDSDSYTNPLFSDWMKTNLSNYSGKLGLYPQHAFLRRSIGGTDNLFTFPSWIPIANNFITDDEVHNNKETGSWSSLTTPEKNEKRLALIRNAGGLTNYAKIGLFIKDVADITDFNKLSAVFIPIASDKDFDTAYENVSIKSPNVYNLPFCKIDGVNDNADIWFEVKSCLARNGTPKIVTFKGNDIWVSPTIDENLQKYLEGDKNTGLLIKNFKKIKFLDLRKVWKQLVEFSLQDSTAHVNMGLSGEIPLNIQQCVGVITCNNTNAFLPGNAQNTSTSAYDLGKDTVSACLETYYNFRQKYANTDETDIITKVLEKQYDIIVDTMTGTVNNNIIKHPILLTQFTALDDWISSQSGNKDAIIANANKETTAKSNPINDYYYNLNTNYGSVAYEYRIGRGWDNVGTNTFNTNRRIDKQNGKYLITDKTTSIANGKIVYKNSMGFGSDASAHTVINFLIFCKQYMHTVNHYLHKFRQLYKGISEVCDNSGNFAKKTADEIWKNSENYCNGQNAAMFYSYANIVNDPCVWKGYPWAGNLEDKIGYNFNEINSNGARAGYVCLPWGTTNWITDNFTNERLLGDSWFNKIKNSHFNKADNFNLAGSMVLDDNETYTDDAQEEAITYIKNMKKAVSIERPYYVEYDNCTKIIYESKVADATKNEYGYVKKLLTTIDNTDNTEVKIMIMGWNPFMWNQDGGWYKNGFTFESIVNEQK